MHGSRGLTQLLLVGAQSVARWLWKGDTTFQRAHTIGAAARCRARMCCSLHYHARARKWSGRGSDCTGRAWHRSTGSLLLRHPRWARALYGAPATLAISGGGGLRGRSRRRHFRRRRSRSGRLRSRQLQSRLACWDVQTTNSNELEKLTCCLCLALRWPHVDCMRGEHRKDINLAQCANDRALIEIVDPHEFPIELWVRCCRCWLWRGRTRAGGGGRWGCCCRRHRLRSERGVGGGGSGLWWYRR